MTATTPITRFRARGQNHSVTLVKPEVRYTEKGLRQESGGIIADFAPDGLLETRDPKIIALLRGKDGFNVDYFEEGNEPGAVKPTEVEVLTAINAATIQLDIAQLDGLLEEEKAGHNRPVVIGTLTSAIKNVRVAIDAGVPAPTVVEPTTEDVPDVSPEAPAVEAADVPAELADATESSGSESTPATEGAETTAEPTTGGVRGLGGLFGGGNKTEPENLEEKQG